MEHRDVSVGICGVVIGVMLGAGSVLYAQESTSDVAWRVDSPHIDARDVQDNILDIERNIDLGTDAETNYRNAAPEEPAAAISEPTVRARRNNHCEQYSGTRMTRCIVEEREGRPYVDSQEKGAFYE